MLFLKTIKQKFLYFVFNNGVSFWSKFLPDISVLHFLFRGPMGRGDPLAQLERLDSLVVLVAWGLLDRWERKGSR